jgi:hypothetical protein
MSSGEVEHNCMDSESQCYIEDQAGCLHDRSWEDDEKPQHSSWILWRPPQQHGMRDANNTSGGAVRIYLGEAPHMNKNSNSMYFHVVLLRR